MNAELEESVGALLDCLLDDRKHVTLRVDNESRIRQCSGDLAWFGLECVQIGDRLDEACELFLELPMAENGQRFSMPRMELVPERSTDLHCVGLEDGALLIFLDATQQALREAHYQQLGNETNLVLRAWGLEIFEERDDVYIAHGSNPSWMSALCPNGGGLQLMIENSPFLENFMVDARSAWELDKLKRSGVWSEVDQSGQEWYLEASAARSEDGRKMLLIQSIGEDHNQMRNILQVARGRVSDLEQLRREVDRKEILLTCIVHDLLQPLSSIVGSLCLVREPDVSPSDQIEFLDLGLAQAKRQEVLIRNILEAFSAKIASLQDFEVDLARAPLLVSTAQAAIKSCRPEYRLAGIEALLETKVANESSQVIADGPRLNRVLANLLANALRHSPRGHAVSININEVVDASPPRIRLTVEDSGPGVSAAEIPHLFKEFTRGTGGGAIGLGLYFCHSCVKAWGGEIGYTDRAGGGACFWIELKLVR